MRVPNQCQRNVDKITLVYFLLRSRIYTFLPKQPSGSVAKEPKNEPIHLASCQCGKESSILGTTILLMAKYFQIFGKIYVDKTNVI